MAAPRRQRILSREKSKRDRDLTPTPHAELLPKHVAVGLRRPGGDPEPQTNLVIGATRCDQFDDLSLPRRDRGRLPFGRKLHHEGRSYSLDRGTAIRQGV